MKLQTAIAIFFVSVIVFLVGAVFFAIRSNTPQEAIKQTAVTSAGFLFLPSTQYQDGIFRSGNPDLLPVTNEVIRGRVENVIFSSNKFALYSEDYGSGEFLTLELSAENDSAIHSMTLEDPAEAVFRQCRTGEDCNSFANYTAGIGDDNNFYIDYSGNIEAGDEVLIIHTVTVGALNDSANLSNAYQIYVTRYVD